MPPYRILQTMGKEEIRGFVETSPLGNKIRLMSNLATTLMMLVEDIDRDIHKLRDENGNRVEFERERKMYYRKFSEGIKRLAAQNELTLESLEKYYNKLGIDDTVFRSSGGNADVYDDYTADSKELAQVNMLYTDRATSAKRVQEIFKFLRSLPSGNKYTETDIARFAFKRKILPGPGIMIASKYGTGTIECQTNGDNWLINMDSGDQRVLTSNQFTITV